MVNSLIQNIKARNYGDIAVSISKGVSVIVATAIFKKIIENTINMIIKDCLDVVYKAIKKFFKFNKETENLKKELEKEKIHNQALMSVTTAVLASKATSLETQELTEILDNTVSELKDLLEKNKDRPVKSKDKIVTV